MRRFSAVETGEFTLDSELCLKALEKVGNPNILVNLVSRRVRQLNSGGGAVSRPLLDEVDTMGAGDIALREIHEDRITYELLQDLEDSGEDGAYQ